MRAVFFSRASRLYVLDELYPHCRRREDKLFAYVGTHFQRPVLLRVQESNLSRTAYETVLGPHPVQPAIYFLFKSISSFNRYLNGIGSGHFISSSIRFPCFSNCKLNISNLSVKVKRKIKYYFDFHNLEIYSLLWH